VADDIPNARWRHDLKNQLGIVLGYSELILQDLDQANPLREDLNEIVKAARQAMTLVAKLEPAD
jgi:signal transduction histidine kinase